MISVRTISTSSSRSVSRRISGVALALSALVLMFPAIAGAADDTNTPGAPAASAITITQNDSAIQSPCLPAAFVLTRQIRNTSEYFELMVRASAPPCDPILAKAAIYSMPGNGVAWPQKLVEVKEFTISKAGTTTIRFDKTCDPVQFDVLTGATPDVISPDGEHHGPLLFPLDTETALQHWGCDESTTTTSSTTTTTSSTTSTTPPVTVETTTPSIAPTTLVVPTSVLGIQEVKNTSAPKVANEAAEPAKTQVKDEKLAYTGAESKGIIYLGLTLATMGTALILVSRRREASA